MATLASDIEAQTRCAQRMASTACAKRDDGAVAATLAKKFFLDESLLLLGLRRLNGPELPPHRWCDLESAELERILRAAARPESDAAQSREEWQRFTMGDQNGYIPPDGLARALKQREALVREPAGTVHAQGVVHSALAGLPASASSWTNLTGYVHPVGRVNDLLIHPTTATTM